MKCIELEIPHNPFFPSVTRSDNYVTPNRNILSTYFFTVFNPSSLFLSVPLAVLWLSDLLCCPEIQSNLCLLIQPAYVSTRVRRIFIKIRVAVVRQGVNFVHERVTCGPLLNQLHMNEKKIDTRKGTYTSAQRF